MTPREQFQALAQAHTNELERDRRHSRLWILLAMLLYAAERWHWLPGAVTGGVWVALLAAALVYAVVWNRRRRWLKQLVCPGCKASLEYFLTDPSYYERSKGKGVPDSVKNCPFCSLPFDAEPPEPRRDQERTA
jgi:hypothetical protein